MADKIYIPGICNIGYEEIARRKQIGWMWVGVTVVMWLLSILLNVPPLWRLILFIPATISAIGFLQAYMKFCANFGLRGVFNFGTTEGKKDTILQSEFRAKDRRKAWQIIIYSVIIGIVVTTGAYHFS